MTSLPDLTGQSHGGFDGAIAATDHENFLVHVVVRFDQAVHDLGEFLAFDAQLARIAGAAERQNHRAGAVLIVCRGDGENVVRLLDVFHFFAGDDS